METDRRAALDAHRQLHSVRQAIGSTGLKLRRTKPGSKRHQDYYDALTKLEDRAATLSETVESFIKNR